MEAVQIACKSGRDHSNARRDIDPTWNARQVYPFGPFRPCHQDYQVGKEYPDRTTSELVDSSSVSTHPTPSLLYQGLISSRHADIAYSNSWAEGRIFVLRLTSQTGDFETLDSIETGGKGLNHMTVLPDCSAIIGAHVCHHLRLDAGDGADKIVRVR